MNIVTENKETLQVLEKVLYKELDVFYYGTHKTRASFYKSGWILREWLRFSIVNYPYNSRDNLIYFRSKKRREQLPVLDNYMKKQDKTKRPVTRALSEALDQGTRSWIKTRACIRIIMGLTNE